MGERGLKFDVAFTSNLERAWRSCAIVLSACGQSDTEVIRSWKLNERHYGALQGHYKDCPQLVEAFGEEKVIAWRRSFRTAPPSLYDVDVLRKLGPDSLNVSTEMLDKKYIDHDQFLRAATALGKSPSQGVRDISLEGPQPIYPSTESLKECQERAFGYWKRVIAPRLLSGQRVLIVAHANTIRALVKAVDQIDDEMIAYLKIPNGVPLVYTLDANLSPQLDYEAASDRDLGFQANYLVSARNHSRTMAYERCVRRKLRALFEYLDTDKDQRISSECLLRGLTKLQSPAADPVMHSKLETIESEMRVRDGALPDLQPHDKREWDSRQKFAEVCEYEIEELIRCVPSADEHGQITLQAFLAAEETLLPGLTKLRLLQ